MNPNTPYGQQMPMQAHGGRRHEMPYGQNPQHMRQHVYPQYYPQPAGPMMPQYQPYPPQWYPQHYPHHMPQYPPQQRYQQPYYPPQMPTQAPYMQPGPLIVTSPTNYPSPLPQQQRPIYPPSHSQQESLNRPPKISHSSSTSIPQQQSQPPPSASISPISSIPAKQEEEPIVLQESTDHESQEMPLEDVPPLVKRALPSLPWLSVQDAEFPPRATRGRRVLLKSQLHHLPRTYAAESTSTTNDPVGSLEVSSKNQTTIAEMINNNASAIAEASTTNTSAVNSESLSTQPTTPSSVTASVAAAQRTPTQAKAIRVPIIPVIPAMPSSPTTAKKEQIENANTSVQDGDDAGEQDAEGLVSTEEQAPTPAVAPKSWAELMRRPNTVNGGTIGGLVPVVNGLTPPRKDSLGDVIAEIDVTEAPAKVVFLKPRGLVNTGNMCYMNSILQILVFCVPFYNFLDKVAQKAAHAFKSNTPLIDAMIMFMKEYQPIDTANSVEQLRMRLKADDFEKYGDSLRPDFVYDTINKLPRFRDMRRGHQQDAQEFLGFLLEELHEECAIAMTGSSKSISSGRSTPLGSVLNDVEANPDEGWHEVGHKQKAAVTRNSGAHNIESPVNSIFGGKLRSEFKIPGDKMSVTFEPYQPLQLDIGSPQIHNITDALKGMTKAESMQGDFQSVRGSRTSATKQVFIETLPPVLVLHLKRFHYDATTKRAEKIWKKIGYPLELELPKEVFAPSARNKFVAHGGLPKYRLTGVIYHHGKNANGGHYTVDIRRQDGTEWIRLDDTVIRRIRSEDVAEGGSEEDPKVLAAALEKHKKQAQQYGNRYENIEAELDAEDESPVAWSQVANGHGRNKSTASAIMNGSSTPAKDASGPATPRYKDSIKDNKVAYLLFYQRI